jgi:hypothetical protein
MPGVLVAGRRAGRSGCRRGPQNSQRQSQSERRTPQLQALPGCRPTVRCACAHPAAGGAVAGFGENSASGRETRRQRLRSPEVAHRVPESHSSRIWLEWDTTALNAPFFIATQRPMQGLLGRIASSRRNLLRCGTSFPQHVMRLFTPKLHRPVPLFLPHPK